MWLKKSTLIDFMERNDNHIIPFYCHVPVSFRSLVDRCGCKPRIYYFFYFSEVVLRKVNRKNFFKQNPCLWMLGEEYTHSRFYIWYCWGLTSLVILDLCVVPAMSDEEGSGHGATCSLPTGSLRRVPRYNKKKS